MGYSEKAKIVALVKLLGSQLSAREILDLYSQYYQEAEAELARVDRSTDTEVEICKRPF